MKKEIDKYDYSKTKLIDRARAAFNRSAITLRNR